MKVSTLALALASAVLFVLSVLIPFLGFLIWFAFVPFLLILYRETLVKSISIALAIGTAFFVALLYWIIYYEIRIFVIVLALTIPFLGFFALLTHWFLRKFKNDFIRILAPPVAWGAVAFLYSLTPIGIIGDQIAFIQAPHVPTIVRATGISGVTFLILLANSLVANWIVTKGSVARNGILIMFFLLIFGTLPILRPRTRNPIKVALVQHNFPISNEWRLAHRKEVITMYEEAIHQLGGTVDLIIFPQYGLPIDALREPEWLDGLAQLKHTAILLGTYIPKIPGGSLETGARTDSALLFSPEIPVQEYQAVTPPPFRKIGQITGTERKPLLLNGTKIGLMLCYEDTRSEEGRLWSKRGAEVLVALSNPGHFLKTPLPRYHLLQDRIRAIETGKFIVRVSPNGFSALIDPSGRVMMQSRLDEERILQGEVDPNSEITLFAKMGSIFPPLSVLASLILFGVAYERASIKRLARKTR